MRKFRWILPVLLIAGILMVVLIQLRSAGGPDTGSSSEISGSPQEKVVLDYYFWDDEISYIRPVANAYTAFHRNVKINLHALDSDYYIDVIKLLLDGDTKIDLVGVRGISLLVQMKEQLLNITSDIINNQIDVTAYGNMYNNISIDGEYYGLPTRSTCWFLLYNRDLFDQARVAYPGQMTWDEYRRLALTMTHGTNKNKVYGGFWPPWLFNFGAIQRSSYLIDDDLTYTKQSLEMLNNFYNVDKSHISYTQIAITNDIIDYLSIFEENRIAMMPQGEWMINMLIEYEKDHTDCVNWDIAPMPVFPGQDPGVTWGQYQFAGIAKDTRYPQECFQFLQFLCGEEGARIYAENGIIHAYCDDEIKPIYLNAVGRESASYFYEAKKVQEEVTAPYYQEIIVDFKPIAQDYLLGKISLEQAMQQLEEARARIYGSQP
ncbi:multiple sugar transport system substrate-binding protein [Anaerotaenia torta]|uniref:ABC transporter substrate-binding protein n=1 Tax=Anaerotaenia torta TaxID=433293 RepID=UPI003D1DFA3B